MVRKSRGLPSKLSKTTEKEKKNIKLKKDDFFHVKKKEWHQIINPYKDVCKIIEIQYGDQVKEEDMKDFIILKKIFKLCFTLKR